ncbi:MAG: FHA domain-containing protein, partial [Blautia sp.]|nr:FHA domain-containing protein [Blautia sp.]
RKRGGFGGLFGSKKKTDDPVSPRDAAYVAETGGQAAFPGGQQSAVVREYVPESADYAAMYGGNSFGEDETEESPDGGAAVGGSWMELIEFSQPGALQRIDLNFTKPHIVIGRASSDEKCPDVAFPGEFKRIGRQHARIERRGNDLFIIDLGSANHTMLNGQVLVPNQPYQLQDGMELAFTVSKPVRYRVHL